MMSPEAAAAAEAVAEEHHPVHSIVYGPLNALWDWFVAATGQAARWGHVEVPEHVAMSIFVMLLCAAIFIPMRFLLKKDRPGRLQQIVELTVEGLAGLVEDVVGHGAARRYVPMIGALALFILIANLTGLFFFLQPPTQNPNTTFALSITAWLYYNYVGVRRHGFGYFKQFLGPVLAMFVLFLPIEIISHLARALSLGLRLFGNIYGEHAVSAEFFSIAPFILPIPVMLLGLFAAMLQAFIFIMLTMVYIAGAEASEH
jgi:F-type H+-transporting ATPase subunit a